MAYRTGVAPDCPVRNVAIARDDAMRNTGRSMDGLGSEAAQAVTASDMGRGVEGMEAAAMEATAMKTAPVKTATMKAAAAVKASTVSAATVTATTVTAATTRSLGNVRERQSQNGDQDRTRKNPGERQRDAFAVPSSQHVCLHRNHRQSGGPAAPWAIRKKRLGQ